MSISFEKEFYKDIRDKKRIGSNIYKAKGKRGYVGKMITTVDLLKGKEKKAYMNVGEMKVTNVYKQLIPLDELQTYTPDRQKQIVLEWKKRHKTREIIEALGVTDYKYYTLLFELGIKDMPKSLKKRMAKEKEEKVIINNDIDILSFNEFNQLPLLDQYMKLHEWNNQYTAKEIGNAWGKKDKQIHQLKHTIKRKLKEEGIYHQLDDNYKNDYNYKSKQPLKSVAINSTIKKDDREQMELVTPIQTGHQNNIEVSESYLKEKEYNKPETDENVIDTVNDAIYKMGNQVGSIKDRLEIYQNTLQSFNHRILDIERDHNTEEEKQYETISDEKDIQHTDTTQGMVLQFNDQKEGFILHQKIERFINVLKKNPDSFKVSISLEMIDE